MQMETEGIPRQRQTWCDCVEVDMESFGLFRKKTQNRDLWRLRIKGKNPPIQENDH